MAVDTIGHILALRVTPASGQDRQQVEELVQATLEVTRQIFELDYFDQGSTREKPVNSTQQQGY